MKFSVLHDYIKLISKIQLYQNIYWTPLTSSQIEAPNLHTGYAFAAAHDNHHLNQSSICLLNMLFKLFSNKRSNEIKAGDRGTVFLRRKFTTVRRSNDIGTIASKSSLSRGNYN